MLSPDELFCLRKATNSIFYITYVCIYNFTKQQKRVLIRKILKEKALINENSFESAKQRDPYEPYRLRVKGLREKLTLEQLGIIIMHMANHSAFVGSPKLSIDDTNSADDEIMPENQTEKQADKQKDLEQKLQNWHQLDENNQTKHRNKVAEHLNKNMGNR